MHLHQRRVDIQDHRIGGVGHARAAPHPRRGRRPSRPTRPRACPGRAGGTCDTASSPSAPARTAAPGPATPRCPRTTRPHQRASASPGPAPCPVMQRQPLARGRDLRRQRVPEPQPVPERPQSVQPDMSHHPLAARLDRHPPRAVSVHLSGALPVSRLDASQHRECPGGRALSRPGYLTSSHAP
jgi:hypothetical protein